MTQRDNILIELKAMGSDLPAAIKGNVYSVPAGYFEGLPAMLLNRINAVDIKNASDELIHFPATLSSIPKQMPYAIPAGYFDNLAEKIIQLIREGYDSKTVAEETAAISPLLAGLKKDMPFSVPQNFFETLSPAVENENNVPAKVIKLGSRKWLRFAAAAVVTGVIIIVAFLGFGNDMKNEGRSVVRFEKKLSKEIKKMSDQELNDFIELTNDEMVGDEKVSNNTSEEIQDLLKDVPDTELKEFLEETAISDNEGEGTSMLN